MFIQMVYIYMVFVDHCHLTPWPPSPLTPRLFVPCGGLRPGSGGAGGSPTPRAAPLGMRSFVLFRETTVAS